MVVEGERCTRKVYLPPLTWERRNWSRNQVSPMVLELGKKKRIKSRAGGTARGRARLPAPSIRPWVWSLALQKRNRSLKILILFSLLNLNSLLFLIVNTKIAQNSKDINGYLMKHVSYSPLPQQPWSSAISRQHCFILIIFKDSYTFLNQNASTL